MYVIEDILMKSKQNGKAVVLDISHMKYGR